MIFDSLYPQDIFCVFVNLDSRELYFYIYFTLAIVYYHIIENHHVLPLCFHREEHSHEGRMCLMYWMYAPMYYMRCLVKIITKLIASSRAKSPKCCI